MNGRELDKAARCGEPSYVWRAGQERRYQMIIDNAGDRLGGRVLENGCGVGMYLRKLEKNTQKVIGLEFDLERAEVAHQASNAVINAACEYVPFPAESFDMILSHEVLEHVRDDQLALREMVRVLSPGGRLILFTPNRGYPFETHGIYWRGHYRFGNIPLINYFPKRLRDHFAPHVRIYSIGDLERLFVGLPVKLITRTIIFGAYDNIIVAHPYLGRLLRGILQWLERTPLRIFGLSHFWVVEKTGTVSRKS